MGHLAWSSSLLLYSYRCHPVLAICQFLVCLLDPELHLLSALSASDFLPENVRSGTRLCISLPQIAPSAAMLFVYLSPTLGGKEVLQIESSTLTHMYTNTENTAPVSATTWLETSHPEKHLPSISNHGGSISGSALNICKQSSIQTMVTWQLLKYLRCQTWRCNQWNIDPGRLCWLQLFQKLFQVERRIRSINPNLCIMFPCERTLVTCEY